METELPLSGMHELSDIYDGAFAKILNNFRKKAFGDLWQGNLARYASCLVVVAVVIKEIKKLVHLKILD